VDADGDGVAASVGLVLSMTWIEPRDPAKEADLRAAAHMDHFYHGLFLDGLTTGAWDDDLDGTFDRNRPELADRIDWVGVNYYAKVEVGGLSFSLVPEAPVFDFVVSTGNGGTRQMEAR
jgi:beta-glucosidase/6-phospho-beta-glucosidase/beta-galactosidase